MGRADEVILQGMNYDEEYEDEDDDDDEENDDLAEEIVTSYACEDCDYRWEVTFEDEEDEQLNETQYCPMCGSANCTQI